MNFEFMKNLKGLDRAYDNCRSAEELVISKPDLSMVSSRKSAEAIAKLVYMVAHTEKAEDLDFVNILSDHTVKDYLGKRSVLDAFHFIRKNGNVAVHTLTQESSQTALAVLERLHYAVGEVAKKMGLINNYPKFDPDIAESPDAVLIDISDTGLLAREIYNDYVISQNQIDRIIDEFADLCSDFEVISGDVELNEILIFDHKPLQKDTVAKIQKHFGYMALLAMRYLRGKAEREVRFIPNIVLSGKNGYTATDLVDFMNCLMDDLPNADGFTISTSYYGPSLSPWYNVDVKEEFDSTIAKIGEKDRFTYKAFELLYNHGSGTCYKYQNGKYIKPEYSPDIIDKDFGKEWWCWNQDLAVEFDFDKFPDIIEELHEAVRRHIPEDQLEYCEGTWEDGEAGILCSSINWGPRKLRVVQDFLDDINQILRPIIKECKGYAEGKWYITEPPFAIATWKWTDEGFIISGAVL